MPDSNPTWSKLMGTAMDDADKAAEAHLELQDAIKKAVLAERERCAKIAENYRPFVYRSDSIAIAEMIAAAIRSGK